MTVFGAVNEFMRDYQDRHGANDASRQEAWDRVRELEAIAEKTAAFCKSLNMTDDQPFDIAMMASGTRKNDEAEAALILALIEEEMAG